MGRMGLPPILKLEEVLELMTDPGKYKAYLVEFKAIYDETKLALGDLHTKEQADHYMSTAVDANRDAQKDRTKAKAELEIAYDEAALVKKESEELRAKLVKEQSEVGARFAALAKERQVFDLYKSDTETYLAGQRSEIVAKQREIQVLTEEITAKRAKLAAALA